MEKNKIIIAILIIVVVILAAAMLVMSMPLMNAQKDSKIAITSNKTLYEGDNLTVKLTDLNKTPIKNESVNLTVTDKDGKVVAKKSAFTNSKGKATFDLDLDKGKYVVNATFGGNANFTGNNTSKNITVKEVVAESQQATQSESSSSSSQTQSSSQQTSEYGSYINNEWVPMTESQYAERYPALYHIQTLEEGRYDKYHPEMYEMDAEN